MQLAICGLRVPLPAPRPAPARFQVAQHAQVLPYALHVLQPAMYQAHSKIHMGTHSPTVRQNSVSAVLEGRPVQTLIVRFAAMTGLIVKHARKDFTKMPLAPVLQPQALVHLNIM